MGAQVRVWTIEEIVGAAVLREILEGAVCRLFAKNATPVERFTLEELGRRLDQDIDSGDVEARVDADLALHLHMAKCSQSSILYEFAESARMMTDSITWQLEESSRIIAPTMSGGMLVLELSDHAEHRILIDALLSGDPDRAELAGREHVRAGVIERLRASAGKAKDAPAGGRRSSPSKWHPDAEAAP